MDHGKKRRKGSLSLAFMLPLFGAVFLMSAGLAHAQTQEEAVFANILVVKEVVNDNGGTAVAGDFTINVTGTNVSAPTFAGSETGVLVSMEPGSYSIDEVDVPGYAKTLSPECSGTLEISEAIPTCTITNDDIAPLLTVTKLVINDNEGTADVADFPLFVDETSVNSGEQNEFGVGEHIVSETNQEGYTGTFSGDCDEVGNVSLSIGDEKECILTNEDDGTHATLTVYKKVINNSGGSMQAPDFTMLVTGTNVSESSFPGSETGTVVTLTAGDYSVDEEDNSSYTKTMEGDCSGTVEGGESLTCTITNDDNGGGNSGGGSSGGGDAGGMRPPVDRTPPPDNGGGGQDTPGDGGDQNVELSSDPVEPTPSFCEDNKFRDYQDKVAVWLTCEGIAHGLADNNAVYTKDISMNRLHFYKLLARATKIVTKPHVIGSDVHQYYDALKDKGLTVKDENDDISGEEAAALIKEASNNEVTLSSKLSRQEAAGALFDLFATAEYK